MDGRRLHNPPRESWFPLQGTPCPRRVGPLPCPACCLGKAYPFILSELAAANFGGGMALLCFPWGGVGVAPVPSGAAFEAEQDAGGGAGRRLRPRPLQGAGPRPSRGVARPPSPPHATPGLGRGGVWGGGLIDLPGGWDGRGSPSSPLLVAGQAPGTVPLPMSTGIHRCECQQRSSCRVLDVLVGEGWGCSERPPRASLVFAISYLLAGDGSRKEALRQCLLFILVPF